MATRHFIHGCQVGKTRRANLHTVWLVGTIAHEVDTKLTFGMLNGGISLTFGHVETFSEEFEVVDQLFHVGLHAFTAWCSHLVVVCDDRTRVSAQPVHALLDDAVGLTQLFDAHQIAVVTVTSFAHRNVEVHAVIHVIRLVLAQVPCNA